MEKKDDSKDVMDNLLERLIEKTKKWEAEKDSLCDNENILGGEPQDSKDTDEGNAEG